MAHLGKYGDPRVDPESFRRKASGFWDYHFDLLTQNETWTCDKRKLNQKVTEAMLDRDFAKEFSRQGIGILDRMFGQGTAQAFSHKTDHDRTQMRISKEMIQDRYIGIDPARGRDDMAMAYAGLGTATNSSTSGSTFTNTTATSDQWCVDHLRREVKQQTKRVVKKFISQEKAAPLRGIPFKIEHGSNLLDSLQRQFDNWTKDQLELVHGN